MTIVHQNTSFLLILLWNGDESILQLKDTFKSCFDEKQHFELLLLTDKKRPKENFDLPSRTYVISSKSDYSILGKLKSKKLLPTEYTHFDVCILLNEFSPKQERIIQSLNIQHTVGFGYERNFIEINLIQSYEKPTERIAFAKQMLTRISS